MNSALSVSAFRQIADDLAAIEQVMVLAQTVIDDVIRQPADVSALPERLDELRTLLNIPTHSLRERIRQIGLIYTSLAQFNSSGTAGEVANLTLDTVWQRATLSFAAMVLGETELGPYHYQSLRGIPDAARYLGKECPFPLWGILARALVRKPSADEPDYVIISDIKAENSPTVDEFPWISRSGSLIVLPLRMEESAVGALILGQNQPHYFQDPQLCADYYDLANLAARALFNTQLRQEITERDSQLVGLQLITKSLTTATTIDKVLEAVAGGVRELMGDVSAHLILHRDFSSNLNENVILSSIFPMSLHTLAHPQNDNQRFIDPQIIPLIEWAVQAGQPVFYEPEDVVANPKELYYNQSGRGLVVPITTAERVIGAIHVAAPHRVKQFEESDMVVLRTITNSVAVALRESGRLQIHTPSVALPK